MPADHPHRTAPPWQAIGEAEACDPSARRFRARAMTLAPLVRSAGWFDPAGADLTLLNGGRCPVLLDHRQSVRDVIGVVEAAWVEADAVVVIARLGFGPEAETAWQNIAAGVWCNVSLGSDLHDVEDRGGHHVVRRWRPFELSLVWSGWCPDAQIEQRNDLAAAYRDLIRARQQETERAAARRDRLRRDAAEAIRSRYLATAREIAADLGVNMAAAEAAAGRAAERAVAAL